MQNHLPGAFTQNLVQEATLDQALVRQYSSLIRLGWFDSADGQPYRQLGWDAVATNASQLLARRAAAEGIVLLKNNGALPLSLNSSQSVGLFGDWANATTQLLGQFFSIRHSFRTIVLTCTGNYAGEPTYLHGPLYALQAANIPVNYAGGNPGGQGDPTTNRWLNLKPTMDASDVLIYVGGISNSDEEEAHDRTSLQWTGAQLDVITQLADTGKPVIVVSMGGGQIDSSPIANNPNISALLWAGYPGQDGGSAIVDILTGKTAPAGRLPQTQYPSTYISEVPMTDMSLRPGENNPGRTYKWYNKTAVFEFGFGLHYTNFSANVASQLNQSYSIGDLVSACPSINSTNLNQCAFASVAVNVTNTGTAASDYVTLGYISGNFGPMPQPKKSLVSYQRLFNIAGGASDTATLNITLASLARVDENGNKVLYPGDYSLLIDNGPLVVANFTLTGDQQVLENWPQPPTNRTSQGVKGLEGYFVSGYGSEQQEL